MHTLAVHLICWVTGVYTRSPDADGEKTKAKAAPPSPCHGCSRAARPHRRHGTTTNCPANCLPINPFASVPFSLRPLAPAPVATTTTTTPRLPHARPHASAAAGGVLGCNGPRRRHPHLPLRRLLALLLRPRHRGNSPSRFFLGLLALAAWSTRIHLSS
jgi:hypothetical protein